MPKIKTNRSAAKRFTKTGSGRIKKNKANRRHILTKKSPKRKRQLRNGGTVDKNNESAIKRMVPYIF